MIFSEPVGNDQAKSHLIKLASYERDSHILLFSGPEGVGKKTFARFFLSLLLGEKHAAKIQGNTHPDIIWLRPEGKLRLHAVASIKQMIDGAPLTPFEAKKKIYVIEEADRMLPSAANAILKLLEEPPSHVSFVLLTSHEDGILPTLVSRCFTIPFYPASEDCIKGVLEQKGALLEKAREIATRAEGSFSAAIKMLSEAEDPIRLHFIEILRRFFLQKPSLGMVEALEHLDKLIEERAEVEGEGLLAAEKLLEDLFLWMRDLHYKQTDPTGKDFFYPHCLESFELQLQKKIPSLETGLFFIEKARLALQRSLRPKVVFERLFTQLIDCTF